MNKKIYIHIGTHKTGSTTIQHFLNDNRLNLERSNYLYPKAGIDYFAHQNIAYELNNDSRFKSSLGTFDDALNEFINSNCEHCILSSENFEFTPLVKLKEIKRKISNLGITTSIIVYIREQYSFLLSEYTQRVKHGFCLLNFDDFLNNEINNSRYTYQKYLSKWLIFDELKICFFDKSSLIDGDVIEDFKHRTKIPVVTKRKIQSQNKQPPEVIIEFIRNLAVAFIEKQGMDPYEFSDKFSRKILRFDFDKFKFVSKINFKSKNSKIKIVEALRKDNEIFLSNFSNYFQNRIPNGFGELDDSIPFDVSDQTLSPLDVILLMNEFYNE